MSVAVENLYTCLPAKYKSQSCIKYPNYAKVRIDLPFRMLIVGSSGSGKTNALLNLIKHIGAFERIYLYAKSPDEPLYKYLIEICKQVEKKIGSEVLTMSTDVADMPSIDSFDPTKNNLVIFDDQVAEAVSKQKQISELFIRGRKQNISAVYLSQSYFGVPQLIRKNVDYIILKKINTVKDLKRIVAEYNLGGATPEQLLALYKAIVAKGMHNWLMIDLNAQDAAFRYRFNYAPIPLEV
jgi:hypothetical protein